MHTISNEARPVSPRDSRRPGRVAAYTAQGERIVKRHSGPTALPLGTTVIEELGNRLQRTSFYGWRQLDAKGEPYGQVIPTDELAYPIVEVKPKQSGHHLTRQERRRDERAARKAEARFKRFKRRRVEEYLAATAAAGIDEQRARAVAGVTE